MQELSLLQIGLLLDSRPIYCFSYVATRLKLLFLNFYTIKSDFAEAINPLNLAQLLSFITKCDFNKLITPYK